MCHADKNAARFDACLCWWHVGIKVRMFLEIGHQQTSQLESYPTKQTFTQSNEVHHLSYYFFFCNCTTFRASPTWVSDSTQPCLHGCTDKEPFGANKHTEWCKSRALPAARKECRSNHLRGNFNNPSRVSDPITTQGKPNLLTTPGTERNGLMHLESGAENRLQDGRGLQTSFTKREASFLLSCGIVRRFTSYELIDFV